MGDGISYMYERMFWLPEGEKMYRFRKPALHRATNDNIISCWCKFPLKCVIFSIYEILIKHNFPFSWWVLSLIRYPSDQHLTVISNGLYQAVYKPSYLCTPEFRWGWGICIYRNSNYIRLEYKTNLGYIWQTIFINVRLEV